MRQTRWLPPSESAFYLIKVGIKPYAGLLAIATERIEQSHSPLRSIVDALYRHIFVHLPHLIDYLGIGLVAYAVIVEMDYIMDMLGVSGLPCSTASADKLN